MRYYLCFNCVTATGIFSKIISFNRRLNYILYFVIVRHFLTSALTFTYYSSAEAHKSVHLNIRCCWEAFENRRNSEGNYWRGEISAPRRTECEQENR